MRLSEFFEEQSYLLTDHNICYRPTLYLIFLVTICMHQLVAELFLRIVFVNLMCPNITLQCRHNGTNVFLNYFDTVIFFDIITNNFTVVVISTIASFVFFLVGSILWFRSDNIFSITLLLILLLKISIAITFRDGGKIFFVKQTPSVVSISIVIS